VKTAYGKKSASIPKYYRLIILLNLNSPSLSMHPEEIIHNFSNAKVAVIGDVMLDIFVYGTVERISPEAPVPILKKEERILCLGGAANVAANVASLGGKVTLFGYTGKDRKSKTFRSLLSKKFINFNLFPILKRTISKTRIIGNNNHQIVRIDRDEFALPNQEDEEKILNSLIELSPDIIVLSDYAKGTLTKNLCSKIIEKFPDKVIADPKPKNKDFYSNIYLITPNLKEAIEMSNASNVESSGKRLQEEIKSNVLVTCGKDGMVLFDKSDIFHFPTFAKEVFDVTGAGDTVVSALALSLASGASLKDASSIANYAAGIVVGKKGTATVSKEELLSVVI
jgi:D-glycero-beta-D-manno-heptose-7-phosphate kinase